MKTLSIILVFILSYTFTAKDVDSIKNQLSKRDWKLYKEHAIKGATAALKEYSKLEEDSSKSYRLGDILALTKTEKGNVTVYEGAVGVHDSDIEGTAYFILEEEPNTGAAADEKPASYTLRDYEVIFKL